MCSALGLQEGAVPTLRAVALTAQTGTGRGVGTLRRPILHRQAPTPDAPVCTPPSGWARVRLRCWAQRAAQFWVAAAIWRRFLGSGPRRGERVRRRPPPGSRPRSSGPARISRSPSLLLRIGEPLGPARLGPARRQGRSLSAVPGSPSHSGVRSRGETATPQSPPVRSGRVTLL
ncbi:hypothetical protein NDU88_007176 [Pleurodeles waltl]|uniref:Uncharacterized protein n=1 Tax=Pleurodeles waltl TaxID=8319 RepID=A0AAV7NVJ9_PLEWA|nr:hypothetical protein NDU88_007176 [Pleurodeles waltl]